MEIKEAVLGGKVYKIDEFGNIYKRRSKVPPNTLALFPDKDGYLKVVVQDSEKVSHNYLIHRVVYATFVGEIPEGMTVDHIDSDRLNNHYSNLQVMTPEDNAVKGNARTWKFVSPFGEVVEIYNLTKFCKENNLHTSHMSYVHHEHPSHYQHKGWRKCYD